MFDKIQNKYLFFTVRVNKTNKLKKIISLCVPICCLTLYIIICVSVKRSIWEYRVLKYFKILFSHPMKNIGIDVYIAVSCNFECSVTELNVKFIGR